MKLNDLLRQSNSPCGKCPYTLGMVHTLTNPCPQCRENGYRMYERFRHENDKRPRQESEQDGILS